MTDKIVKAVYDFLLKHNRPYSLNDVQNHTKEGKAGVTKALALLVEEGKVVEKTYGKQKIYYVNQDMLETLSDEELAELKEEIRVLSKRVSELSREDKRLDTELKNIHSLPSMAKLEQEEMELRKEMERYEIKPDPSQKVDENYDPEEHRRIKIIHRRVTRELEKRKSIIADALEMILDGSGKTKDDLIEEIGLEIP